MHNDNDLLLISSGKNVELYFIQGFENTQSNQLNHVELMYVFELNLMSFFVDCGIWISFWYSELYALSQASSYGLNWDFKV